jgi:hypothetical protein
MLRLYPHPATPARAVKGIEVAITLSGEGAMWLRYHVEVDEALIVTGIPAPPNRRDGLWQTTCFEAFIAETGNKAYLEFNFAPSSEWAAYHFTDYREGMANIELVSAPQIGLDTGASHFSLEADVMLPAPWAGRSLEISLSAVLETCDGAKSYWAFKYPAGNPDFHHRDCFALKLSAEENP